ncbi:hypothetical protein, partial [Streptomyces sp. NPDC048442]|uniref:hypothetical protein n=1 Tax=Streptomyces sp. NPDC048442 TaxID=3154823 RepID=UPI003423FD83
EFSRNGRFLCTHPRGLSSGRFRSVFHFVLFLHFRLYQTVSVPTSSMLSRFFAFAFSLSGGSDSIRSISAELIGVDDSEKESRGSQWK